MACRAAVNRGAKDSCFFTENMIQCGPIANKEVRVCAELSDISAGVTVPM